MTLEAKTIYCDQCGTALSQEDLFCLQCGAKQMPLTPTPTPTAAPTAAQPASPIPQPVSPTPDPLVTPTPVPAQTVVFPQQHQTPAHDPFTPHTPTSDPFAFQVPAHDPFAPQTPPPTSFMPNTAFTPQPQTSQLKKLQLPIIIGAVLVVIVAIAVGFVVWQGSLSADNNRSADYPGSGSEQNPPAPTQPSSPTPDEQPGHETPSSGANDSANASGYILPDSSSRYISDSEIYALTDWQRFIARNEVFARHGRGFDNQELREYFAAQPWYTRIYSPQEFDAISPSPLNAYELENVTRIRAIEVAAGSPYVS